MKRHKEPLTAEQQKLVTDNYRLVYSAMQKYYRHRKGIDKDTMECEFAYNLCRAARSYDETKGSFSGWAFYWFHNGFMELLRQFHRRGITGVGKRGKVKCLTFISAKSKTTDEFSMDELILNQSTSRQQQSDVREAALTEMRSDFAEISHRLSPIEADILSRRMAGDSFRSIGLLHRCSKQNIQLQQVKAINKLGQNGCQS